MKRKLAIQKAKESTRGCLVTGLRIMHGHKVSNSNRKTKRLFKANISHKNLHSEALGMCKVRISRKGERTIEKYGGLDNFLSKCKKRNLTLQAINLRKKLNLTIETNPTIETSVSI